MIIKKKIIIIYFHTISIKRSCGKECIKSSLKISEHKNERQSVFRYQGRKIS